MQEFQDLVHQIFQRGDDENVVRLSGQLPVHFFDADQDNDQIPVLCDVSGLQMGLATNFPALGTISHTERARFFDYSSTSATTEQSVVFDHHCRHAYMRSRLSRLDSDCAADGVTSLTDPCLSDIIEAGRGMSEVDLVRFLNILKLKILNG